LLPSKSDQIKAVAKFLDSDKTEGRDLEDIAKEIVEGYLDALTSKIKLPAQPIRVGMLFKSPTDAKVKRVVWIEGDTVWYVTDSSLYGWLGPLHDDWWSRCEEFRPRKKGADGKMAEMTDDEIAEAWDNAEHKVGDRFSQNQRQNTYEVIAVGPVCVLMRNVKTYALVSDSNRDLERYYRRELEVGEIAW
jgi:hypothetical protein